MNQFNMKINIEDLISNFFEGVMITDFNGQIKLINQAGLHFFTKLTLSDLIGKPIQHFVFSKELELFFKNRQRQRNIPIKIGMNHLLANFRVIDGDKILIVFKNITQVHQLNRELNIAHENIRLSNQILDYVSDGICFIDRDENIVFYNKKMGELDSKEPESVRMGNYTTALQKKQPLTDPLLNALKTESPIIQNESFFASNGKRYNIVKQNQPLFSGNKKVGALSVVKDYSEISDAVYSVLNLKKESEMQVIGRTQMDVSTLAPYSSASNPILFSSDSMKKIVSEAKRAANSAANILIYGEPGVGKSLLVDYIKDESEQPKSPFYSLNCGLIPDHLLEKTLFGSVNELDGSRTTSLFELANGGTIFLEEINHIGIPLQQKLLKVVKDKRLMKRGDFQDSPIDIRFIASMNLTPEKAFKEKMIVEDLLYYLGAVTLRIPLLKERREDIPVLATHFIEQTQLMAGNKPITIHSDAMTLLSNYDYPGNIQQLAHIIEGAVSLLQDETEILPEHLPDYLQKQLHKTMKAMSR